jgi:ABC-type lipoprotein release transport system permease subunit
LLNRLAPENLRYSPLQTLLSVVAVGVEVAVLLTLVGIRYGLDLHPNVVRTLVGGYVLILLWFVFGLSFLIVTIGRYAAVSERAQDIGILRFLGASPSYILNLLFQETLLIVVPGTTVGIAMAYGTKWLIEFALSDFMIQEIAYKWWPIAGAISAVGALLGAILPAWKALGQDPVHVLSSKDE